MYRVVGAMEDRIKKALLKEKNKQKRKRQKRYLQIVKNKSLRLTKEYKSVVS